MRFPTEAHREVQVRYNQPSCMGGFARVALDFEPLPDGELGFEFLSLVGPDEIEPYCVEPLAEGIRLWLLGVPRDRLVPGRRPPVPDDGELRRGVPVRGEPGLGLIAVRAVLHDSRVHEIDSTPWAHLRAGRRAADKALSGALGRPVTEDLRDRAPAG
ncbi:hypothetical protein [Saccharothrix sp. ST-888]|uniref:hypothetical protein n=1 Tax=Saccharothrix sp. ST-888 TaxID=1427391 RepID=UPI0005ED4017|nr:hypothetical protein [Saccharothrix sp. ST-888]